MRINNNVVAQNSHRQLGLSTAKLSTSVERLSSGMRVNRAADDAAGLAISEKMRTQIRGLNRASLNIQDGISLTQVADGALQNAHDIIQRMRELSVQSANGTNALLDREAIQLEFGQLTSEINQLMNTTNFNNRLLFDGSIGASWEYNLGIKTIPYTTTIPATGDFQAPVHVAGWTAPPNFGVAVVGTPQHFLDPNFRFPSDGLFAMQIVTPAHGTLNVILDFAETNFPYSLPPSPPAATTEQQRANMNFFLNYFQNGFNSMVPGLVENVRYGEVSQLIYIDFPRDGNVLTGPMGQAPNPAPSALQQPRVGIGMGAGTAVPMGDWQRNSFIERDELEPGAPPWIVTPVRTFSNRPANAPPLTAGDFRNDQLFGIAPTDTIPIQPTATPPPGGFPSVTIEVEGVSTTIFFQAGGPFADAESFIEANRRAFETASPRAFDLAVDEETGRLLITTRSYAGGPQTVNSFAINPTTLADLLGFGGTTLGDITTERDEGGFMWIQSGANQGDGIMIEIPRLCTRSLGLSIRRPEDETTPGSIGFPHISGMGSDGYTTVANVTGDPAEFSLDVTSHERAANALAVLDNAINIISMERARLGAQTNRMEFSRLNVDNTAENLQASESRIRDTDMAFEMTTLVRNQILQQSGTAMLAQANTLPQATLQLLG